MQIDSENVLTKNVLKSHWNKKKRISVMSSELWDVKQVARGNRTK